MIKRFLKLELGSESLVFKDSPLGSVITSGSIYLARDAEEVIRKVIRNYKKWLSSKTAPSLYGVDIDSYHIIKLYLSFIWSRTGDINYTIDISVVFMYWPSKEEIYDIISFGICLNSRPVIYQDSFEGGYVEFLPLGQPLDILKILTEVKNILLAIVSTYDARPIGRAVLKMLREEDRNEKIKRINPNFMYTTKIGTECIMLRGFLSGEDDEADLKVLDLLNSQGFTVVSSDRPVSYVERLDGSFVNEIYSKLLEEDNAGYNDQDTK